mmetsp:Transcript_11929/g.29525  ORF Transcript_11929/g.29525 Transcript_11929/m.29525 type:complete len:120 (-) Transcript_11929:800-1159(-)
MLRDAVAALQAMAPSPERVVRRPRPQEFLSFTLHVCAVQGKQLGRATPMHLESGACIQFRMGSMATGSLRMALNFASSHQFVRSKRPSHVKKKQKTSCSSTEKHECIGLEKEGCFARRL